MASLRIVADENIPGVADSFGTLGEIVRVSGRQLNRAQLQGADIVLVRSVTQVDRALLAGTSVRFVATATIGTDHLDLDFLRQAGIAWAAAPGSNADSVAEYIISVCCHLDGVLEHLFNGATVGIIGMGNVGARLYQRLQSLGVSCRAYDPFLSPNHYPVLTDLDTVLQADIVCCHTPLTTDGSYPTRHLLNAQRLAKLKPHAVLINAGRGAVIDNAALLELLQQRPQQRVALDVWEHEPHIDRDLLARVAVATPHIAGYSADGKLAGTQMIFRECCRFLGIELAPVVQADAGEKTLHLPEHLSLTDSVRAAVFSSYSVAEDDRRLRSALAATTEAEGRVLFDQLRRDYPQRFEFRRYHVANSAALAPSLQIILQRLGFSGNW